MEKQTGIFSTTTTTLTLRKTQRCQQTAEGQKQSLQRWRCSPPRTARANLSQGIRRAKKDYTDKITTNFKDSRDTQSLWKVIQAITDYKPVPRSCENNTSLLSDLNSFFARFEAQNDSHPLKTPSPPHEQPLHLSSASMKRTLATIYPAAGPGNIPGRVLKNSAEELKDVFTDVFNIYLEQAAIPSILKAATKHIRAKEIIIIIF